MHAAVASVYGATVTVSDLTQPMLSEVSGPLTTDDYKFGLQTATFAATDNTGIRTGRIYVDDVLKASATYPCDFTYAVPCSNKTDAQVDLDTRSLPDGPHSVQVAAVDPAGNETRSTAKSVFVDNGAPATPGSLVVDGGSDWRSTNSFDVNWVNPADAGAPVASAHYELCAVDGSGCFPEQTAPGADISHLAGLSVPSPGAWALRVWLQDAAGNVDSANAAEVTLRFGAAPSDPTTPTTTEPSVEPAPSPALSDPLSPPSLDPTSTPRATSTRLDPRLRLTSARLTRGRLVLRGRAATTATGRLALTIRLRGSRSLHRRTTIRGGRFSIVIPTRARTRPRTIVARFAGSATFRPATATLRVSG